MARHNKVLVSLTDQELVRLDEFRGGVSRAVYFRQLLQGPPDRSEVASHGEALAILTQLARDGKATPAIALERALRGAEGAPDDGWMERLLGDNAGE